MRYYNENYVVNEYGELFSLFGHKLKKLKPYVNNKGYKMYRLRVKPNKSKSGYRITNTDNLPSQYIKSKEFVGIDVTDENIVCINGKYVRRNRCSICGEFTSGNLCLKCYKDEKSARIPSRESLIKDLMTNKSLVTLAKQYDISDNAYRKWLTKRGLPTKFKDIKSFIMSV